MSTTRHERWETKCDGCGKVDESSRPTGWLFIRAEGGSACGCSMQSLQAFQGGAQPSKIAIHRGDGTKVLEYRLDYCSPACAAKHLSGSAT